jgi:hypothetical protein
MNDYYVYVHTHEGKPFYVGKGRGDRWLSRKRSAWWLRVTRKYKGFTTYKLHVRLSERDALYLEKKTIKEFRAQGFELVNLTDGGEGLSGFKHSDETRKKMSHRKHSDETRKKMSQTARSRAKLTEGDVRKIRSSTLLLRELAIIYHVCISTIFKIQKGIKWQYVQ